MAARDFAKVIFVNAWNNKILSLTIAANIVENQKICWTDDSLFQFGAAATANEVKWRYLSLAIFGKAIMRTMLMTVFGCAIFSSAPLLGGATAHANAHRTVAFYSGPTPPLEDIAGIDMVVLEPDHVAQPEEALQLAKKRRQALFAYVSIGEINATRNYFALVPQQTLRTENKNWGSWTVDQTSPMWREFLPTSIIEPLWRQGWRGFFLDTLDSYRLFAKTDLERERQRQALVETIKYLKARHSDAMLIFNRGFELLPDVFQFVHAVAAESLYRGYDAARKQYSQVTPSDRDWLAAQLANARDWYRLPAIAIDYQCPTIFLHGVSSRKLQSNA